jgi:hypothetical protein
MRLSAVTATALTAPFISSCNSKQQAEERPVFFSAIAEDSSIIKTGVAYRKSNRHEDDENTLKRILLSAAGANDSGDAASLRTQLANAVDADFKNGKVLVVNGWVLSLTEARQCALFSILTSA